eukprot:scaffold26186_cov51-Phaeocystis_antarctica.AAC.5
MRLTLGHGTGHAILPVDQDQHVLVHHVLLRQALAVVLIHSCVASPQQGQRTLRQVDGAPQHRRLRQQTRAAAGGDAEEKAGEPAGVEHALLRSSNSGCSSGSRNERARSRGRYLTNKIGISKIDRWTATYAVSSAGRAESLGF